MVPSFCHVQKLALLLLLKVEILFIFFIGSKTPIFTGAIMNMSIVLPSVDSFPNAGIRSGGGTGTGTTYYYCITVQFQQQCINSFKLPIVNIK